MSTTENVFRRIRRSAVGDDFPLRMPVRAYERQWWELYSKVKEELNA